MSTKDKTRDKLMSSMRKTKAGVNKDASAKEPEEKSTPIKVASKKKTTPTKKPAIKTTKASKQVHADPYQSKGCSVWPD